MYARSLAGCDEAPGTFELFQEENTKYTEAWVLSQLWKTEAKTDISRQVQRSWFRRR